MHKQGGRVMLNKKQNHGFTIVELLIVIVVIAILAAITIVAYNGITKKAQTSAYASGADQLEKTLRLAFSQSSDPNEFATPSQPTSGPDTICFGSIEDYPASTPFNAGECAIRYSSTGTVDFRASLAPNLATQLKELNLPNHVGRLPVSTISPASGDFKIIVRGYLGYIMPGNTALIFWYPPDRSSCSRATEVVTQITAIYQSEIDKLISIRDGYKTIEEVYGPNSSLTMADIPNQITIYQNAMNSYTETYGSTGVCQLVIQ